MNTDHDPARRTFLKKAVQGASAVAMAGTLAACGGPAAMDRQLVFGSLADALRELERLANASQLKRDAVWTWPQTLVHCAQSIEYSLTGFPQAKPPLFQRTVGNAAFGVFSWRGHMSHDLAEPIPGAPALDVGSDTAAAVIRLQSAIRDFLAARQPLQPHFAYGELTRAEYERAHAMHLADHFSAFDV